MGMVKEGSRREESKERKQLHQKAMQTSECMEKRKKKMELKKNKWLKQELDLIPNVFTWRHVSHSTSLQRRFLFELDEP